MIKKALLFILLIFSTYKFSTAQFGGACASSGLELWYKANSGVTYTFAGVDEWDDQETTTQYDLTSSGSARPAYFSNALNGYPVIAFGTDDYLESTSIPVTSLAANSGTGISVYMVIKATSGNEVVTFDDGSSIYTSVQRDLFYWDGTASDNTLTYTTAMGSSLYEIQSVTSLAFPVPPPGSTTYKHYKNGSEISSKVVPGPTLYSLPTSGNADLTIGKINNDLSANIAEILWFDNGHQNANLTFVPQIHTYLSLKYGISQDGSQPVYNNSSSTVVWDYSDCNKDDFDNRITGLLREDCYNVEHTKSTNQDDEAILTGVLGSSFNSSGTFGTNKQYFLWGDDNGDISTTFNTSDVPINVSPLNTGLATRDYKRIERIWKVSEYNNSGTAIGDISYEFDLSGTIIEDNLSLANEDIIVLYDADNDGDFSDETHASGGIILPSSWDPVNKIGQFTLDFEDCDRFTFAQREGQVPVTWVSFEVDKKQDHVNINWSTGLEINNSHFDIERSTDGELWLTIGTVSGKGDYLGVSKYSFVDYSPAEGINYYRVKQNDYDGKTSKTRIKNVLFASNLLVSSSVYPNPAQSIILIDIPFNTESVTYQIIDLSGNVVMQGNVASDKNELSINELKAGVYTISLSNERVIQTHRLIVN